MAQEANCSICTENYDDAVRCPRVLRCGHSLCQSCLSRFLRCPGAKACPECRYQIKPNRVADFPKNFGLLQLLPAIPAVPVVAPCDTGCGGEIVVAVVAPVDGRRKRRRGGRRQRSGPPRDPVRDYAIAWNRAHRNFESCGCEACAEWAHGIGCRCHQCNQQMIDRGILCIVCGDRYDDWGWNFGYCGRSCWHEHMHFIPVDWW